jgi:Domain of unknown function (DUF4261)
MGIAHYLLQNGPVLKPGHTIGTTYNQKLRIYHTRSMFNDRHGPVIRIAP